MAENSAALKNLINRKVAAEYADGLSQIVQNFDKTQFLSELKQLDQLELKPRVQLIARGLKANLPFQYNLTMSYILKLAMLKDLKGFAVWPLTEFINLYGVDDFETSFSAMYELTQRFTAEFSVRPFINKDPKMSFRYLSKWAKDKNVHVRRLASEGSRPRLPWGEKLHFMIKNPQRSIELLEKLKFDSELYVRKSVANHLNDVAKDHPSLVIKTLKSWKQLVPKGYEKEFQFLLARSLRTLIKDGNIEALKLMNVKQSRDLAVKGLCLSHKNLKFGSSQKIEFTLSNKSAKSVKCIIDYAVHFRKANGEHSRKVFKLKNLNIEPKSSLKITKNHPFKKITTRKYYNGLHKIEIVVNGRAMDSAQFMLTDC
jgi:3-methyladenine DNA glycosylase AlkC